MDNSAAGTIIALVDIAAKIGKALKDYHDDVRDAREDIRKLYGTVQSLKSLLDEIRNLKLNTTRFQDASGPLSQAAEEFEHLLKQLVVLPKDQRRRDGVYQSLKWPLDKKYVEKRWSRLREQNLALVWKLGLRTCRPPFCHVLETVFEWLAANRFRTSLQLF